MACPAIAIDGGCVLIIRLEPPEDSRGGGVCDELIPVRLSVRNFLSYRDDAPTLDLEGVHVACLCGDNGHGKSALLDAITWALWGKSRAGVQEDLIYQGESEMQVELEFLAGDGLYRVSRRHGRAGRGRQGTTFLELYLLNGDTVQPISGSGVRETEQRITSLLRMTYDTFVNSAFILQGRSNLFTAKRPNERKEVLGEVLDLSRYEWIAERARREARDQGGESLRLDAQVSQIDREVSQKDEHAQRLSGIEARLEVLSREETERQALTESLQDRLRKLQSARCGPREVGSGRRARGERGHDTRAAGAGDQMAAGGGAEQGRKTARLAGRVVARGGPGRAADPAIAGNGRAG